MSTLIDNAIARSISHNEIVHVECSYGELEELIAQGDDSAENGRVTEVWGTDDGNEWRVHAELEQPLSFAGVGL